MTDVLFPSPGRGAVPDEWAALSRFGAATGSGFVATGGDRLVPGRYDEDIASGPLGGFDIPTVSSSLTVTITGGEAFIEGRYVARDTSTDVTLPANSTETVVVGFDTKTQDGVVIGTTADVSADRRLPLWEVTTDGNGVISVTDQRPALSLADALTHGNNAHDPPFSEASHDHTGETINPEIVNLDTLNTADVSGATENQFPKKAGTGSDLTFGTAAPDWQESTNSPFSSTNTDSETFTLSDTFDLWLFHLELIRDDTSDDLQINARVNGQTSSSAYRERRADGSRRNFNSRWGALVILGGTAKERRGTFQIQGRWGADSDGLGSTYIENNISSNLSDEGALDSGRVSSVASPLDSITMFTGSDWTELTLEAYGRDI